MCLDLKFIIKKCLESIVGYCLSVLIGLAFLLSYCFVELSFMISCFELTFDGFD